jgi:hypothetical protein
MNNGWKKLAIISGVMVSVIGGSIGYGQLMNQTVDNKEDIKEVKIHVEENQKINLAQFKENQKINVEQTIKLNETSIILKQVAKTLDKVEKNLEK